MRYSKRNKFTPNFTCSVDCPVDLFMKGITETLQGKFIVYNAFFAFLAIVLCVIHGWEVYTVMSYLKKSSKEGAARNSKNLQIMRSANLVFTTNFFLCAHAFYLLTRLTSWQWSALAYFLFILFLDLFSVGTFITLHIYSLQFARANKAGSGDTSKTQVTKGRTGSNTYPSRASRTSQANSLPEKTQEPSPGLTVPFLAQGPSTSSSSQMEVVVPGDTGKDNSSESTTGDKSDKETGGNEEDGSGPKSD